jgi:Sporulation and spore germination
MEWRARSPRFERSMNREASSSLSKGLKTTIVILAVMVALGLVTLPGLRQTVQRLRSTPKTEEQARRDVMQEPISTPTDVEVQAHLYWLSAASPASLEPTVIQLPLSADRVERSKQLLIALITRAPAPEKRTLPVEASLLAFYIQPDGTAIADFSDEIASGLPSGILSEQLAVQSIALTLGANMTGIRQLKILVHGQEAETLAGHLDLYGLFPVPSPPSAMVPAPTVPPAPTTAAPTQKASATPGGGQTKPAGPVTASPAPIKKTP